MKKYSIGFVLLGLLALGSCGNSKASKDMNEHYTSDYLKVSPDFNVDSAYQYVKDQVDFGVRQPNSKGHTLCGNYLVDQLKKFGAKITLQEGSIKAYDGKMLQMKNIIGSYNPQASNRILLLAHWDTRPIADQDPDKKNQNKPILGANDAGSGVGVLLEVARILQQKMPAIGVDIAFMDLEDYGSATDVDETSWCLGSQYFSTHSIYTGQNKPRYAILLDMVAGKNATFYKEMLSMNYAPEIVDKVWSTARQLGYGKYFKDNTNIPVTDDHVPLNKNMMLPAIDIIHTTESGFPGYWHTLGDTMSTIDKNTLKAVGQTVLEVIYKEK